MHRTFRRSIPPSVRAIENASRRPTLCFVVRDDENKTGGMIVREKNLPAEVGKTQTPPRSASEVIAEMAAKVARYPAKPKEEWEGMSAEEMYQRGEEHVQERRICGSGQVVSPAPQNRDSPVLNTISAGCITTARGVPQDDAKAVKWYHRAAEQGLARRAIQLSA